MSIKLDIYVEGQRLDLFKDEAINIKSSLKDSMSPDKIFTAVSTSYTVPASKVNNKIFKHYYRTDIGNTIDAREFLSCELRLGGVVYRQGNLSLEQVSVKNGTAHSYSIRFYGNLTELTKRIGEDELTALSLTHDNISSVDWKEQLRKKMDEEPAVAFPVASTSSRLIYHSTNSAAAQSYGENYRNIAYSTSSNTQQYGIDPEELVGAYRCKNLLDAIEDKYGITIVGALRAPYVSNYRILLQGAENTTDVYDELTGYGSSQLIKYGTLLATISSTGIQGTDDFNSGDGSEGDRKFIKFKISSQSISQYTIHLLRDGQSIASVTQEGIGDWITYELTQEDGNYNYTFGIEYTGSGSVSVDFYLIANRENALALKTPTMTISITVTAGGGGAIYSVSKNLPKLKIKDFLTILFKQFNIVTVVDGLEVKTFHYDFFMAEGDTIDITEYVDSSSATIKPPTFYSGISFKHEDPATFMEVIYSKTNRKEYGSFDYSLNSDDNKVIGSFYDIKIPTQRVPTERLKDLDDNSNTDTATLQLSDENGDKISTKPIFLYCSSIYTDNLALNNGSGTTILSIDRHSVATNVYYQYQIVSKYTAISGNFWGAERDEYHADSRFSSLGNFNCFWNSYIRHSFDTSTRTTNLKAKLPLRMTLKMELSTKVIVGQDKYIIESISTDFNTGISSLKLSSISEDLLDSMTANTVTVSQETNTDESRIVYLSSVTGRLEITDQYTVNAVGGVKNVIQWLG